MFSAWAFREIICQVHKEDNSEPVGTFTHVNDVPFESIQDFDVYNCPSGEAGNTFGTTNADIKELPLTFLYMAPSPSVGDIYVR